MATHTLRPLSIGEILDAGIKVLTRHWKVLMVCVVGLVLPMRVIQVLLLASVDPDQLDNGGFGSTDTSSGTGGADFGPAFAGYAVSLLLYGLVFLVAFTACFKAVSDAWLGSPPEVGRSLRFGVRRLGGVLGAYIVWAIGLTIAFLLLIIPGIHFAVAWSLTLPALLFEECGVFKAFGRSRSLVKGRWWPACALIIVGYLLVSILGAIIQGLLGAIAGASSDSVLPNAIAAIIGGTISSAITTPYLAAVLTIFYFDQRVRKEGFDLQLMAAGLGTPHDPEAPIPAPLVGEDLTPEQRAAAPYWPPPPGWTPPPARQPETHGGWDPPAAGDARGWARDEAPTETLPAGGWAPPTRPEAPTEVTPPAPEDPGQADDAARDAQAPPDPAAAPGDDAREGESPRPLWHRGEDADPEEPKRDPRRADWLPPDAPRGPGGL